MCFVFFFHLLEYIYKIELTKLYLIKSWINLSFCCCWVESSICFKSDFEFHSFFFYIINLFVVVFIPIRVFYVCCFCCWNCWQQNYPLEKLLFLLLSKNKISNNNGDLINEVKIYNKKKNSTRIGLNLTSRLICSWHTKQKLMN